MSLHRSVTKCLHISPLNLRRFCSVWRPLRLSDLVRARARPRQLAFHDGCLSNSPHFCNSEIRNQWILSPNIKSLSWSIIMLQIPSNASESFLYCFSVAAYPRMSHVFFRMNKRTITRSSGRHALCLPRYVEQPKWRTKRCVRLRSRLHGSFCSR